MKGEAVSQTSLRYIDWYKNGRLAPYVSSQHAFGDTMSITEAHQPAGDMSDPAVGEIVFVVLLSGNARHTSDFGAGRFTESATHGTIYIVPPHSSTVIEVADAHSIRAYAIPAELALRVMGEHMHGVANLDFGPLHSGGFRSPFMLAVMERLWAEARSGNAGGRMLAEGGAQVMLAEAMSLAGKPREKAKGGLAPWAERRVIEYLRARAFEDVSLSELAALVQLSPFHFARMFKATTGLPPHAYQRRLRCEHAQELLRQTDLTIGSISVAVGYETPQAFARMFRAETGRAPSDWRREARA